MVENMSINQFTSRTENLFRNELFPEFQLIKKGATHLFFHINSLSLFRIDSTTYDIFSKLLKGHELEDILEEHNVRVDDFKEIVEILFKNSDHSIINEDIPRSISNRNAQEYVLDQLVLNVSNACNLTCRYCYAKGGSYGQEKSFMKENTAIRTN